jgi:hypothetical protein
VFLQKESNMTLINLGLALVIFLVLKPWRLLAASPSADEGGLFQQDGEEADVAYRHEVAGEPEDAVFTSDGRVII